MRKKKLKDPLATLLKEELMDIPSVQFSDKLLHAAMISYRISYSEKYKKEEWLGKAIMLTLIFFNLMILYFLKPFTVEPVWVLISLPCLVVLGILVKINIKLVSISSSNSTLFRSG